ncbi:hypothetical protein L2E82_51735 [Cichorium intybus]|nr:hypothetical protein L2E82_51735 [Cichorium intybus]
MVWPTTKSREPVGDYNHSSEREAVGDSEEDKDWENNDSFSDEDQLISSDDGTNVGFSDEDDEQFNLDDDADSMVRETVFENAINASTTCAGEKSETHAIGGEEVQDAITTSPFLEVAFNEPPAHDGQKSGEHATVVDLPDEEDEQCDLEEDEETIVQETVPEVALNEQPAHAGHKTGEHVTVVDLPDAGVTPKTKKIKKTEVSDTVPATGLCACDLNRACSMGACLSIPDSILKASPAHVGDKMEGNVTVAVVLVVDDTPKTQKKSGREC